MRTLGAPLLLLLLGCRGLKAPPPLEDVLSRARAEKRTVVLDFYTDWCGPCREFEKTVLPDARVAAPLSRVSFVRYDAEQGNGRRAAEDYGVHSYPLFLAIDERGRAVTTLRGLPSPEKFADFLRWSRVITLSEAMLTSELATSPSDPETLLSAARWYARRGQRDRALGYYQTLSEQPGLDPVIADPIRWERLLLEVPTLTAREFVERAARYLTEYPKGVHADDALALLLLADGVSPAEEKRIAKTQVRANWEDAPALNQLVYVLLAGEAYDEALVAARRQVALKPDAPNPYDTLAEVHHMRKERALALEVVDQGESLMSGPGARVFLHNRPRFEKGDGLSSSVVDRRQTAAIYLPALRPEGASATAPNPAQQAFLQVADQVRTRVKEACWADSQGFKGSLIARLELAPKGGPPTKVELVTAAAAPLAACIQRTLGETSFPVPPPPVRGTFTLPINF